MKKTILSLLLAISSLSTGFAAPQKPVKYEFRGVWVQTVWQTHYAKMSKKEMQTYFINMLDQYQQIGINAFIFQVRPKADAFYRSSIEPWSQFFTGQQGKAPAEDWDPMEFLIDECHKRGMEFHAWINPYRVTINETDALTPDHLFYKHPDWFIKYGRQIYFDPALPQCRNRVFEVVEDIIKRYNVDGIHMDDYFYPYPITGVDFPDNDSFNLLGPRQGFNSSQKADWRRNNVNLLISGIKQTIMNHKPWVRFGISPFGIYRNKKSHASGSHSDGIEAYTDLYADILHWDQQKWIDYLVPQLYWEIGHARADYQKLIKWWNDNTECDLFIGENIVRTMDAIEQKRKKSNQLPAKVALRKSLPNVKGSILWTGYDLQSNYKGIADSLNNNYFRFKALTPPNNRNYKDAPGQIKKVKYNQEGDYDILSWQAPIEKDTLNQAVQYNIYRFKMGERVSSDKIEGLCLMTSETSVSIKRKNPKELYMYTVVPVNRFRNEGKESPSVGGRLGFFERFFNL